MHKYCQFDHDYYVLYNVDNSYLFTDGALLFKQVPLLRIDDMEFVQTGAIVRYVAKKGGLYSADDKTAAM
jgi:hypothetical protein